MKKTLAILLAALMLIGMFSFASAEAKTYKVGVSIYQFTDNFMTLYRNEIENYFKRPTRSATSSPRAWTSSS